MSDKKEKVKLSKWLDTNLPPYFPDKGDLISLIELTSNFPLKILFNSSQTLSQLPCLV